MIRYEFISTHRSKIISAAKLAMLVAVVWALAVHINSQEQTYSINSVFAANINVLLFALVLIGMPLNWLVESYKWRYIMRLYTPLTVRDAVIGTLSGTAVSLFMPNRIGSSAGRLLSVPADKRKEGVLTSTVAGFAQLNVTLILGTAALPFYLHQTKILPSGYIHFAPAVVLLLIALLMYAYFHLSRISDRLERLPFLRKKTAEVTAACNMIKPRQLWGLMALSTLRYLIFAGQFMCVLYIFVPAFSLQTLVLSVAVIYLVTTVVPSFTLAELGIRESAAVFLLAPFTGDPAGVLTATFLLWLINIAVPAGAGALLTLRTKPPQMKAAC